MKTLRVEITRWEMMDSSVGSLLGKLVGHGFIFRQPFGEKLEDVLAPPFRIFVHPAHDILVIEQDQSDADHR